MVPVIFKPLLFKKLSLYGLCVLTRDVACHGGQIVCLEVTATKVLQSMSQGLNFPNPSSTTSGVSSVMELPWPQQSMTQEGAEDDGIISVITRVSHLGGYRCVVMPCGFLPYLSSSRIYQQAGRAGLPDQQAGRAG